MQAKAVPEAAAAAAAAAAFQSPGWVGTSDGASTSDGAGEWWLAATPGLPPRTAGRQRPWRADEEDEADEVEEAAASAAAAAIEGEASPSPPRPPPLSRLASPDWLRDAALDVGIEYESKAAPTPDDARLVSALAAQQKAEGALAAKTA